MKTLFIFFWIFLAMIATAFWEAYSEGRNSWAKGKHGFKISILGLEITGYHFFLFGVMYPILLLLPFVIFGWNWEYVGITISAYFLGMIIEDICWYIVNPVVQFHEFWSDFSNYYPWIRYKNIKIVPLLYIFNIVIAFTSWYVLWK
jgi:hypothetical protein